jgi:hypothetical protein
MYSQRTTTLWMSDRHDNQEPTRVTVSGDDGLEPMFTLSLACEALKRAKRIDASVNLSRDEALALRDALSDLLNAADAAA